jgi:hypothetical protein
LDGQKKNIHIIHMENFDKKLDNLMTQLETLQLGDTIKLPFSKKNRTLPKGLSSDRRGQPTFGKITNRNS